MLETGVAEMPIIAGKCKSIISAREVAIGDIDIACGYHIYAITVRDEKIVVDPKSVNIDTIAMHYYETPVGGVDTFKI